MTAATQDALIGEPRVGASAEQFTMPLWAPVVLVYSYLLPREVRIEFSGLVFFADRLVSLALLPLLLYAVWRGAMRLRGPDILVLGLGGWMVAAMASHYGLASGIERGGALALDATISYFVARSCIKNTTDFQKVLILVAPGFALAGLSMALESISGRNLVRPAAVAVFGALPQFIGGEAVGEYFIRSEFRLGLMRATGPFPHSILGGLFLASLLPLYLWARLRGWPRIVGALSALCGFFGLSSAALLALVLGAGFIIYDRIQKTVRELNWTIVLVAVGALALAIQIAAKGGLLYVIIRYLTLNPATGSYRQITWDFGLSSVRHNPLFGIGFEGFDRPSWMISESVDAHWLLIPMRFGIPAIVFAGALAVWAIVMAARASTRGDDVVYQQVLRSLCFSQIILVLMAFTVSLTGSINGWLMMLIGVTVTLAATPPTLHGKVAAK